MKSLATKLFMHRCSYHFFVGPPNCSLSILIALLRQLFTYVAFVTYVHREALERTLYSDF